MDAKQCKVCFETKAIEHFKLNGLKRLHTCRSCTKALLEKRRNSITEMTCRKCSETKPIEQFKKNGDWRSKICKVCDSRRSGVYSRQNPEAARQRTNDWIKKNPERHKELSGLRAKKYRLVSADKLKANRERYRASEKGKAKDAEYRAAYLAENRDAINNAKLEWMKKNKDKVNANTARRNAVKKQAKPGWANEFFIGEVYDLAQRRSVATGILWSVDHIVPMVSKLVCGLHTEQNLRVIPHEENRRKNNRYWPDMP